MCSLLAPHQATAPPGNRLVGHMPHQACCLVGPTWRGKCPTRQLAWFKKEVAPGGAAAPPGEKNYFNMTKFTCSTSGFEPMTSCSQGQRPNNYTIPPKPSPQIALHSENYLYEVCKCTPAQAAQTHTALLPMCSSARAHPPSFTASKVSTNLTGRMPFQTRSLMPTRGVWGAAIQIESPSTSRGTTAHHAKWGLQVHTSLLFPSTSLFFHLVQHSSLLNN